MPVKRAPVVARELAAQIVDESGLVGRERRQRETEDEIGDVVGSVLREGEQEQAERPPRIVVEAADEAEVQQREPAVLGQQDVAAVRIGVVDAVDGDLLDVGAEELAREHRCTLWIETVFARRLARR